MAIPTSRTKEAATIDINSELCNGCGLCVNVCKDFGIELVKGKAAVSPTPLFGCIGCGHCMAICPEGAIQIHGRYLESSDLFDLPSKPPSCNYEALFSLFQKRRSIREFSSQLIEEKTIQQILDAALTAPMGIPPSDVHVLVIKGKQRVRSFSEDYCRYLYGMRWMVSGWFLTIMRPFWSKSNDELFRKFLKPLIHAFTGSVKNGIDLVTYDAPLAMYFYGSPYCDPADPIVAATYAMLAGETLGLGTCMLGGIHPMIQSGRKAAAFRKKHGIRFSSREGLFVIFGHPAVQYKKGIRRTFASVDILGER